jgi:hypothetical protein
MARSGAIEKGRVARSLFSEETQQMYYNFSGKRWLITL